MDDKPKSTAFLQIFGDPLLAGEMDKVAFAKVDLKKDAEECKKWKVTQAATLVLIDASGDEPKVLKTLSGVGPKAIKTALEDQLKKAVKK